MKQLLSFVATLVFSVATFAQSEKITWRHHVEHQEGNEYRVIFTGRIAPEYHTYTMTDEFSPTEFLDMTVTGGELVGEPYEISKPVEEMYDGELAKHYYNEIILAQNVKLNAPTANITGTLFCIICTRGVCSVNYHDFNVVINPKKAVMATSGMEGETAETKSFDVGSQVSKVQQLLGNRKAYIKYVKEKHHGKRSFIMTNHFVSNVNKKTKFSKNNPIIVSNFEEGLVKAEQGNKPIFVNISGYGCIKCREMEARVWSDPRVKELMKQYIVVNLPVDDRERLPEDKWIRDIETGEYYKSVGRANNYIARTLYNTSTQPTYVLLKPNGEILIQETRYYNLDINSFIMFLAKGLAQFELDK